MTESGAQTTAEQMSLVVVTVGGSPDPILHVLRAYRPEHVLFVCSEESRSEADKILSILRSEGIRPHPSYLTLDRPEDLGPCYAAIRRHLDERVRLLNVSPDKVLVDYTGGTKTMSAALVLAAVERFHHFNYVGGSRRNRDGLGVVISGKERDVRQPNPWEQLAVRDVERARDLWDHLAFEEAARVLREAAARLRGPRRRFEALADLASAMGARHRLDFRAAKNHLDRLQRDLPNLCDGEESRPEIDVLLRFVKSAHCYIEKLRQASGEELLREILDNAIRTARERRWEDAAARLYRAMEMRAHLWLEQSSGGVIRRGQVEEKHLPEQLRGRPYVRVEGGKARFSLESAIRAAADLGCKAAQRLAEDIAKGADSCLRRATEKRNSSILAHGVTAIGEEGFEQMKKLAKELFEFDLDVEAHPIPPFDVRWLMPGEAAR
ncbi:MAG: TIGR02710 family CRISPR-associated CARF protein [Kiritimatiellae bacterium]|nr:TIGR02710 family CRISPR-associated CARF protein [Kiritimatiellia bacterium]